MLQRPFGFVLVLLAGLSAIGSGCSGSGQMSMGTGGAGGGPAAPAAATGGAPAGSGGSPSGEAGTGGRPSGEVGTGGGSGPSTGTGGHAGQGGTASSNSGGASSGGAAGATGGRGGGAESATGGGGVGPGGTGTTATGGGGMTGAGTIAFSSDRVIVTGVRGTSAPPASSTIQLHNGGQGEVQITRLTMGGADQALFKIDGPSLPANLASGSDMAVTIELLTTSSKLPAAPTNKDNGATVVTGTLTAESSAGMAMTAAYGVVNIQANYEPTLGQIVGALGHKLNVGRAQSSWNPNTSMNAVDLPGVESGTDEVAAKHFVKAGSGNVSLTVVARFSPYGQLPYGWHPATSSTMRNVVGTMSMVTDAQTNNKARMFFPPLAANSGTSFDPGSAPFGLWVYTDQVTQKYESGGKAANSDYDFSDDALNSPANVHRFKTYSLKDASGAAVPQTYLVAVEEAGNGDYQDYVYVIGNVNPAP